MKVVILCGGKGTRLREETEYRPKPMVPIGDRPILWHIMKGYAVHGFKEFILCLGSKGEMIKEYFRNYQWMATDVTLSLGPKPAVHFHDRHDEEDWSVTLADTGLETMTGGRLNRIRRYLGSDETFLFTYGDGVGNIDIPAAVAFHRAHGKLLTLTAVHPPGRFGELGIAPGGVVREFDEKPQTEGGWINGGFFVASSRVFDFIPDDDQAVFEQEAVRAIAAAGELRAFEHRGFWQPMDTHREFLLLDRLWTEARAPWKTW
ncbi:MAG: glucose-1-phosphate cytidylyltransferase [Chthoniobacteraceae bacterium]